MTEQQPARTEQRDAEAEAAKPPIADVPVPTRQLQRSATNRVIGGVCGGLGERTDIDPILFRVVTAVLVLVGGAGLILYGAAMLLIPDARTGRAPIDHVIPRSPQRNVGVATVLLAIVCALVVIGGFTGVFGGGSISLVVIAALAVLVAHRRGADLRHAFRTTPEPQQAPPGPQGPGRQLPGRPPQGPQPLGGPAREASARTRPLPAGSPADEQATQYVDLAAFGDRRPPLPQVPRPPRTPSISFLVWLAAVAVGVGVHLLQQHRYLPGDIRVPLAAALATLGVGLLASAWVGRARVKGWGVLLTVALAVATVVSGPGERIDFRPVTWAPTSAAALAAQQPYEKSVGEARLDLTRFPAAAGKTYQANVRMTAGQLTVLVPESATVDVSVRCSGCAGTVLGDRIGGGDGGRVNLTRRYPSASAKAPVVDLVLRVTAGNLEVRRVA
ncbi:MAG TPA: PspC domain-containing protein [Streptosporangiales bacterium]